MKRNNISVYVNDEDKQLLDEASESLGIGLSAFFCSVALREARKIKREIGDGS